MTDHPVENRLIGAHEQRVPCHKHNESDVGSEQRGSSETAKQRRPELPQPRYVLSGRQPNADRREK